MNMRIVEAIAKKDIRSITSNTQVWLGLVLLPVLFGAVMPGILILVAKSTNLDSESLTKFVHNTLERLPAQREMLEQLPSINHQFIYFAVTYLFGTLFLLIPILNALMIALNGFVGEKERNTLESLMYAPISIKELFVGKIMAAFIPAFLCTIIAFVLYGIVVDSFTYSMFGRLIFPNSHWMLLLIWVTPGITLFTILISVFISARSKGFQEAQQLGGIIVLPLVGLLISQVTGLLFISKMFIFIAGGVLLLIDFLLLLWIAKVNQRDKLFESQVI
ncbi:MAG: hypothetical protein K0Q81_641 [Paenibacillus sp.]|nr:hypothetical protein [Paenibacillus sp.]